ncbi:hypothetical protein CPC08DRAFT_804577, partial [Agrocybe pediades]
MSENSFFANSSNVRIRGGQFNKVKGSITIFDQSRHTSTINSFNATTIVQENVNTNNSRRCRGIANPSQSHRQRSAQQSRHPNAAGYFLSPTVHPAMATHLQSQEQLPPGSCTEIRDSFNTTIKTMHNIGNDNSSRYHEGPYTKRKRRSRRQKATYNDGLGEFDNDSEFLGIRLTGLSEETMDGPSSFSPPDLSSSGSRHNSQSAPQEDQEVSETQMPHVSVSSSMPVCFTAAQNVDGVPEVAFDVEEEDGEVDESDNSGSSSEYEEPRAISRVKSAPPPEDPSQETSGHGPPISNPNSRYIYGHTPPGPNPSTSNPKRQPPGPASPSSRAQSAPEAFDIQHSFITPHPSGGSIVFGDIKGDYKKTDQSGHNTFLNSGNMANTFIRDSYNDNSVQSYAAPTKGRRTLLYVITISVTLGTRSLASLRVDPRNVTEIMAAMTVVHQNVSIFGCSHVADQKDLSLKHAKKIAALERYVKCVSEVHSYILPK